MTKKRKLFCEKYLSNGFNATQAAIDAGYSRKSAYSIGPEILEFPEVKAYLNTRIKSLLSDTGKMTLEWVQNVLRIARADIRRAVSWDDDSVELTPSDEIDDDTAYAISEVSDVTTRFGRNRSVKLESKTKALELLGKYLAILSDTEPKPETDEERLDRDERKRIIAALAKKA